MTSYNLHLKDCPSCHAELITMTTASNNTIDAIFYTDGYIDGPMFSYESAIVSCPLCRNYFWDSDVPTKKKIREYEYSSLGSQIPIANGYMLPAYLQLIQDSPWRNNWQEKYIRFRAWWEFNHQFRKVAETNFQLTVEQSENLQRLALLLVDSSPSEVLAKAEIFRQLGNFEGCLELLNEDFHESYVDTAKTIAKLANDRLRKVEHVILQ